MRQYGNQYIDGQYIKATHGPNVLYGKYSYDGIDIGGVFAIAFEEGFWELEPWGGKEEK